MLNFPRRCSGASLKVLFDLLARVLDVGDFVGEEEVFAGMVLRDLVDRLVGQTLSGQAIGLAHVGGGAIDGVAGRSRIVCVTPMLR